MDVTYESHYAIKIDKLCPFKLLVGSKRADHEICNWHSNIEILLITSGSGKMLYGNEHIYVEEGDVVVINSGAIHRLYLGYEILGFIVDEGFCAENGIDTRSLLFEKVFKDSNLSKLIKRAAEAAEKYGKSKSSLDGAKVRCRVLDFIIEITDMHSAAVSEKSDRRKNAENYVKTILLYMNMNFKKPITLEELAELCGVTKFHLTREFKRYTGSTVFGYINTLKCKHAEGLILQGMGIANAAFESGFESTSYFSRTYKKLYGQAPSRLIPKENDDV